jgi:hypothetical protein
MNKNIDYSKKYLKYKNKYIELKNNSVKKTQLGGIIPDDVTEPTDYFVTILNNIRNNICEDNNNIIISRDPRKIPSSHNWSPSPHYFSYFIPNEDILNQFKTAITNTTCNIHLDFTSFHLKHNKDEIDDGIFPERRIIRYIDKLLGTNKITSLNFTYTDINQDEIQYLLENNENIELKQLILSHNTSISVPLFTRLFTNDLMLSIKDYLLMKLNCKLEYLQIQEYGITTEMINTLMDGITMNNTLLELSIINMNKYYDKYNITYYDPLAIFNYLRLNHQLKHLRFNMDTTNSEQKIDLVNALRLNTNLKSLCFHDIKLDALFINNLLNGLLQNNSITTLGLNNFNADNINDVCDKLINLFTTNTKLINVELIEMDKRMINNGDSFIPLLKALFNQRNIKKLDIRGINLSNYMTILVKLINNTNIDELFIQINLNTEDSKYKDDDDYDYDEDIDNNEILMKKYYYDKIENFFTSITNYAIKLNINFTSYNDGINQSFDDNFHNYTIKYLDMQNKIKKLSSTIISGQRRGLHLPSEILDNVFDNLLALDDAM